MEWTEEMRRRAVERLQELRPMDDDFMRCLFKNNIPLAQFVLRIITGMNDLIITECETQKDMRRLAGARSICLDAYGTDSLGRKYDLEIQRADKGADPHRARYHSSVMDIENLSAAQSYHELPDTYTIFITEKDVFALDRPLYRFEAVDTDTGLALGDGRHILYVNGACHDDSDIGRLMSDFRCRRAEDMQYKPIAERTKYLKEHPKGVSEMCKAFEDLAREFAKEDSEQARKEGHEKGLAEGRAEGREMGRAEGREMGRAEGREMGRSEGARAVAMRLLARGMTSLEDIAEIAGLSLDEVKKLQAEHGIA